MIKKSLIFFLTLFFLLVTCQIVGPWIWNWGGDVGEEGEGLSLAYLFIEDQEKVAQTNNQILPFGTAPSILAGGTFSYGRFTVGQNGRYEVLCVCSIVNQSGQADDTYAFIIRKNAMPIAYQTINPMAFAGENEEAYAIVMGIFDFVLGDVIDIYTAGISDAQHYISRQLSIKQLPASTEAGGSLWTQAGIDVFYTTGKVGIGTATPSTILHLADSTGITFGDGTDADQDLITVDVTGLPKFWWDEAPDVFAMNKGLALPGGSLYLGSLILSDSDGELSVGGEIVGGAGSIFNESTGLIQGGIISINSVDNTLIDITAGSGQVVDSTTDPNNPILTSVPWTTITGYNLTTTASSGDVVAIFLALDSNSNIVERLTSPTPEERRDTVDLGIVARLDNGIIVFAGSGPANVVHNPGAQLQDLLEAWGTFNVEGNRIQSNAVDTLQIKKTEGSVFHSGSNFHTDGKNPHISFLVEQAPVSSFNYKLGDGTDITLSATAIDPDNYDDGTDTLVDVPNNKWTVQYISVFASGVVEVLYGQEIFGTEEDAITAISCIDFIIPIDSKKAIPLSYLVLQQGDTSLPTDRFYCISRLGAGGGSLNYWNRANTELSPANVGDSVVLAAQTELSSSPNFTTNPGWTIFSGLNSWAYDSANDWMEPTGELTGDTIADTGITLTSGLTYVITVSWKKSAGSLQIYQGSAGTQKSDYMDDGTLTSKRWIISVTASENIFVRTTAAFHSDTTTDYISELSVIEIDDLGDLTSNKLALGGLASGYFNQLDNYEDISLFFPPNKGIFTTDEFIIRNCNSGGLDFDETYARPLLSSYATDAVLGSSGYTSVNIRADENINLRTYSSGGKITLNPGNFDTDVVINNINVFVNNASAIAGGLTAGCLYRSGADPSVLCIVY